MGLGLGVLAGVLAQLLLMRGTAGLDERDKPFEIGARLGLWVAFWDPELTYGYPGSRTVLRSANQIAPAPVWELGVQVGSRRVSFGLDFLFDRLNKSIGSEAGLDDADRFVSILRGQLSARLDPRWLLASTAAYGTFHGGVTGRDYQQGTDGTFHPSSSVLPISTRWFAGEVLALYVPRSDWAGAFGAGLRFSSYTGPTMVGTFERDLLDPRSVSTENDSRRSFLLVLAAKDLRRLLPHLYSSERWFAGADLSFFFGYGGLDAPRFGSWTAETVGGEVDVHVGVNLGRVAISAGYRNQVLSTSAGDGGPQHEGDSITGVDPGTMLRSLDFFHGPSLQVSGSF